MSDTNPQTSDDVIRSENPSIAEDPQFEEQQNPHSDSQSPKALILDNPDPPEPDSNPQQIDEDAENPHDSAMEDATDPQFADDPDTISAPSPRNADTTAVFSTATSRRGQKRKKDKKRTAQEKKSREKFQVLIETLKPIPFIPAKVLDFNKHETLLKRLELWEFVHIEFDRNIRRDLLAKLIAGYIPNTRCSYVDGIRIAVARPDLGRALKMQVKKGPVSESVMEGLDLAESIAFIEDFVSNWMLLHEDTYIMPSEVLNFTKIIREGQLEKVDWAGLIWCMVDKELKNAQLENCYYASHLQHLIKVQHESLLRTEPKVETEVKDEEEEEEEDGSGDVKMGGVEDGGGDVKVGTVDDGSGDVKVGTTDDGSDVKAEKNDDGSGDVKMDEVDDAQPHELEEQNISLSLGQDNVEKVEEKKERVVSEHMMDFEKCSEEEPGLWVIDRKNSMGEPFLQQCTMSDVNVLDCEQKKDEEGDEEQEVEEEEDDDDEEEVEEDGHEAGFHPSRKCIPLEGMSSGSLLQAMETTQMPFSSGIDLRDNPVGDFLSSRDDAQMISQAPLLGNGHKRDIGQDGNSHHSLNGSNKRARSDNPWDAKPFDFDTCMENIQQWMGKARILYSEKEQALQETTINQQFLLNELQRREDMINQLYKAKMEEGQRRQSEVHRLEKELYMMTSLLEGYRKGLKETQKAFAEYRARCPQADEPLYKDVPGSGGLVLSVMELEKERQKQEEEERMKRLAMEKKLNDFEGDWIGKLEDHQSAIEGLENKLLAIKEQIKLLNEVNAKRKVLGHPECAPSEEPTA